jgi:putative endonuclease
MHGKRGAARHTMRAPLVAPRRSRSAVRWHVYLVRTRDGALYTGIALDVAARLAAHAAGTGAKALRGRGPLQLAFTAPAGARGKAQRLEARIKRLAKTDKERLVADEAFAAAVWRARTARPTPATCAPREGRATRRTQVRP